MHRMLALFLLVLCCAAQASGPVAPSGWNAPADALLGAGQPCCQPADLNGSGLVGGAFVFVADAKNEFAVFALTYSSALKPRWSLLERHPIAELSRYAVSIAPPGPAPNPCVKVCRVGARCVVYALASATAGAFARRDAS
jgi:hypothetical protein